MSNEKLIFNLFAGTSILVLLIKIPREDILEFIKELNKLSDKLSDKLLLISKLKRGLFEKSKEIINSYERL